MPRLLALLALLTLVAAGCGRGGVTRTATLPALGAKADSPAATDLGFPAFATKNTTRIGGADPAANAAATSRVVFSGQSAVTRPRAVALVDGRDWRAALAASVLMSAPVRAPMLLSDGLKLPRASADALDALRPDGSRPAGGAQVIRVGVVAHPKGRKTTDVQGANPFAIARGLDAFIAAARGKTADRVLIVSADDAPFALPAAAWAAKSGDPILFVHRNRIPPETRAALAAHQQPKIYVLGPSSVVSPAVTRSLRALGTVTRVGAQTPVANAIAFARFADGAFGWNINDPGHGFVFARADTAPATAGAVSALSASGTYGPLVLLGAGTGVDAALEAYLLDVQPGYSRDPVRGVYNHGWIVGDARAISVSAQSDIDSLLEIVPVNEQGKP